MHETKTLVKGWWTWRKLCTLRLENNIAHLEELSSPSYETKIRSTKAKKYSSEKFYNYEKRIGFWIQEENSD